MGERIWISSDGSSTTQTRRVLQGELDTTQSGQTDNIQEQLEIVNNQPDETDDVAEQGVMEPVNENMEEEDEFPTFSSMHLHDVTLVAASSQQRGSDLDIINFYKVVQLTDTTYELFNFDAIETTLIPSVHSPTGYLDSRGIPGPTLFDGSFLWTETDEEGSYTTNQQ